jgi:lipopolysaccharide/colanic/teichoic acid biosynthesis glycosyltransferase
MSLVGPRPMLTDELERQAEADLILYYQVRPGLSVCPRRC